MNTNKNLWKKGVVLAAAATMIAGAVPTVNAFAYGAYDVSKSTFKSDTDNSADSRTGYLMYGRMVKKRMQTRMKQL